MAASDTALSLNATQRCGSAAVRMRRASFCLHAGCCVFTLLPAEGLLVLSREGGAARQRSPAMRPQSQGDSSVCIHPAESHRPGRGLVQTACSRPLALLDAFFFSFLRHYEQYGFYCSVNLPFSLCPPPPL